MIYIGLDYDKQKILYIVHIKSWDKNELKDDVLKTDDYDIIYAISTFQIVNWLADGLELEDGIDTTYNDGDVTVIKEIFKRGFKA